MKRWEGVLDRLTSEAKARGSENVYLSALMEACTLVQTTEEQRDALRAEVARLHGVLRAIRSLADRRAVVVIVDRELGKEPESDRNSQREED